MKKQTVLLIFLIFIISSCDINKPKKIINIQNEHFINYTGIYFLSDNIISKDDFQKAATDYLPSFSQIDKIPDSITSDNYLFEYIEDPAKDFTPPDIEYLKKSGVELTNDEGIKMQNAVAAFSLFFFGPKENVFDKQLKISEFLFKLTQNKEIVIVDYNTYQSYNPSSWKKQRIDNFKDQVKDITSQITIHLYRETEFCRAITMGMEKFSLPDISLKDISCKDQYSFASLINLLVQTLAEKPYIYDDYTISLKIDSIKNNTVRNYLLSELEGEPEREAIIKLNDVDPEEGDADNKQFQIVFENSDYLYPQEEQQVLIGQLFGATDAIDYINHDEELLFASNEAKRKLPELKTKFNSGLEPGAYILLKAPFETDNGGNEWMWVEITEWESEKINGILQNDPFEISDLKAGAIVTVIQSDVFDYIYGKPDGTTEGNETGKIIEKMNK